MFIRCGLCIAMVSMLSIHHDNGNDDAVGYMVTFADCLWLSCLCSGCIWSSVVAPGQVLALIFSVVAMKVLLATTMKNMNNWIILNQ